MAVSKDFLDSLDKVLVATDKPCTCNEGRDRPCEACDSNDIINEIWMKLSNYSMKHEK